MPILKEVRRRGYYQPTSGLGIACGEEEEEEEVVVVVERDAPKIWLTAGQN